MGVGKSLPSYFRHAHTCLSLNIFIAEKNIQFTASSSFHNFPLLICQLLYHLVVASTSLVCSFLLAYGLIVIHFAKR